MDDEDYCEHISEMIKPVNGIGGLYLGDYTSTDPDNLNKFNCKAIISAIPNANTESSAKLGYVSRGNDNF
jgi:hypothetical protein